MAKTTLMQQLGEQRRTVDFDTFDIQLQELLRMLDRGEISIAPAYQRQFRWDNARCSQLMESLMLGIPIPNLFMATNADNTWEVVDGVQRLSAVVKFAGEEKLRNKLGLNVALTLENLQKLDQFNGLTYDGLPPNIQQHLRTRPLKVVTLNDKSDTVVRLDLFERLNTGGISLTKQEIRNCVYQGPFAEKLGELAKTANFRKVVKLTSKQNRDGTLEECVLRFFAFLDRYKKFDHSVTDFLNDYMKNATAKFDFAAKEAVFHLVFKALAKAFPNGITRGGGKTKTPLNLYEGVAVGAALALQKTTELKIQGLNAWLQSQKLRDFTTGATNDRSAVVGRIEFCRDHFLGKQYVRQSSKRG